MQFSEQWLREWVNPDMNSQQLADVLTMGGLEISALTPASGNLNHILVGKILSVVAHADSDRLHITQVDVGTSKPITVVTNVAGLQTGAKVAVATVGAMLPDGMEITETALRGITSQGMFCSLKTLGLTDEDNGLLHFPCVANSGEEVATALGLHDDKVLELEITPNRGDCLSILGIAREVGVLTENTLTPATPSSITATSDKVFPVTLDAPAYCPHYVGRVVENVDLTASTPLWMQEKLRRSGIRSINAVVDVTNYVMLELGQPMHAFDLATLQGGIHVRVAEQGEQITLLDGKLLTLQGDHLIIADEQRPLALAGVMGAENSGVTDNSTSLFLESAYFEPTQVARCAQHYGLSTDSSYRFERGVDPQLQAGAMERATELLLAIVGGQAGPLIEKRDEQHLPVKKVIGLRRERIPGLLGFDISDTKVVDILQRLGMDVGSDPQGWQVMPPSHRHDIAIEQDLIEECARVNGYDNIPTQSLTEPLISVLPGERFVSLKQLKDRLNARGYHEAITYSFVDDKLQQLLNPGTPTIPLANPISSEMNVMRTNCWAGLINVLQYNANRQQKRCRFFESGLRFYVENDAIQQEAVLSGLIYGTVYPESWNGQNRVVDFYDLKSDVLALLAEDDDSVLFVESDHAALHPWQQAAIWKNGKPIGLLGQCHPQINERLKISGPVFLFEILSDALQKRPIPQFQTVSKFPTVRRDLALVVEQKITAQQILDVIVDYKSPILVDSSIFDVYTGEGLAENEKSIAISLIYQHLSHTLKESDVNESTDGLVAALAEAVGAKLRDW